MGGGLIAAAPRHVLVSLLAWGLLSAGSPGAAEPPADAASDPPDLAALSLEELLSLEVTSVSRRSERISDAPAAVYVLTAEDIRRSGATSIPELLRMVPGVQVAHIDGNKWAISARGLAERFADKLLVLIDGRSVYTPLFGGVFWDVQDTLLEDIDRIEVIRGPGGTLWGANAVNGVINIITRGASETQGGLVVAGGGDRERAFGAVRYGGRLGERFHYRAFAKYFDREPFVTEDGDEAEDGWNQLRGGFRVDGDLGPDAELTVQGDLYVGNSGGTGGDLFLRGFEDQGVVNRPVRNREDVAGGNLLGRIRHRISDTASFQAQAYFDRTTRKGYYFDESRNILDLDIQHQFRLGDRQEVVWGAGYRFGWDAFRGRNIVALDPSHRSDHLFSAFLQDEIELLGERLWVTAGSKIEHNSYTGTEVQPSLRFRARPLEGHTLWGAVSRAVRTPTRADEDIVFNVNTTVPPPPGATLLPPPVEVAPGVFVQPPPIALTDPFPLNLVLRGDRRLRSTVLLAYELGYRFQPTPSSWLDLAVFVNDYRRLGRTTRGSVSQVLVPMPPFVTIQGTLRLATHVDGQIYGGEVSGGWQVTERWRVQGSYSLLKHDLSVDRSSFDPEETPDVFGGRAPTHQFHLRSYLDLPGRLQLDAAGYWVGNLATGSVPSYFRADLRLAWRPCERLELSLVGQNLFERSHPERRDEQAVFATEVPRSVFGTVRLSF